VAHKNPDARERLIIAARSEFARAGMAGARTDRIARQAAVNKQLLHYYFDTKAGLYQSVLERAGEEVASALAAMPATGLTGVERLRRLVRAQFDYLAAHTALTRLLIDAEGGEWVDAAVAPLAALRFGELCMDVGLPAGLVNVVPAGPEGGDALVRHPGIRKIHFTGGDATARKVLQSAAANLTPVVTELGGNSANIIFGDADLDAAAMLSAHQGPLMQSGQSCACASRVLVHESVHDAFVEKFVAVIQASTIGDPLDPQVVCGPVISQGAADRILAVIEQAVTQRSGELIVGGKRLGGELAQGYYIEPTVFIGVDNASALAQTETFGPVVSVIKFSDEAEAVRVANDTNYGLNAFVQTTNLSRAHRVARQLEAGSVWINTFSDISPQGPYGGCKQSGFGRTGGLEGLHEFLQVKNIRIGMR